MSFWTFIERNLPRCGVHDWYAGQCELVRGHEGLHHARWWATGESGEAVWKPWNNERPEERKKPAGLPFT